MNGLLVLVAYAAVMVIVTVAFSKKGMQPEEFHVGKRKMGTISSAMSIAATWIWAPALIYICRKSVCKWDTGAFLVFSSEYTFA